MNSVENPDTMSDMVLKMREQRVRRQLAHFDCVLKKTPSRHWSRKYYPVGYMVINASNWVIAGCGSREYESDLADVERCAFVELPAKLTESALADLEKHHPDAAEVVAMGRAASAAAVSAFDRRESK